MKRYFLIIVLMGFLTAPVCAALTTYTYTQGSGGLATMGPGNWSFGSYVQKGRVVTPYSFHWEGQLSGNDSQDFSGNFYSYTNAGAQIGHGTYHYYSSGQYNSQYKKGYLDMTWSAFDQSGQSGNYSITNEFVSTGPVYAPLIDSAELPVDYKNAMPFSMGQQADGSWPLAGDLVYNDGSPTVAPVASFSCVPTSQYPGQNVVCTDTSTNSPTYWKWMYGINGQDEAYWGTAISSDPSGQNLTFTETYPALYTVKLYVNNSAGEDWENKTDYINFNTNATPNNCNLPVTSGYIRTAFQCLNSQDSSAVVGCDMQLRDNEGNAWSNATNLPDGGWCIDTLPSHSINAYAQASGYSSATRLNLPVLNQIYGEYAMLLIPGYVPAAPSGSVYLYVTVNDYDTHVGLSGATVEAAWSGGGHAQGNSDSHGVAMLTVKNSTSVYLTAAKTGYVSINKVISTTPAGPDTTMMSLHKGTITATPTMTTGPGGTIPVTQGRTDQQSQAAAGSMVLQYMPALVSFFILLIIVGGVKMMGK